MTFAQAHGWPRCQGTVVVMNPTHYAWRCNMRAARWPALFASQGRGRAGLAHPRRGRRHDVPVWKTRLWRALYAAIEIDEPVPAEHFKAVAQVIGYVSPARKNVRRAS